MTLASSRRILVVVAHPDDEVLGCGGTLHRHIAARDEVWVVIVADGESSRDGAAGKASIAKREAAANAAAKILGVQHLTLHRLPDNRLDTVPLLDLVALVEQHVRDVAPDAVYTHHLGDLNVDHQRVHQAVLTACRPQPGCPVSRLLFFETVSSTEWQTPASASPFVPNWFVDIGDAIEAKIRALEAYTAEMRPWPHARSYEAVRHLARWRGAAIGCDAAEAFILGREIRR